MLKPIAKGILYLLSIPIIPFYVVFFNPILGFIGIVLLIGATIYVYLDPGTGIYIYSLLTIIPITYLVSLHYGNKPDFQKVEERFEEAGLESEELQALITHHIFATRPGSSATASSFLSGVGLTSMAVSIIMAYNNHHLSSLLFGLICLPLMFGNFYIYILNPLSWLRNWEKDISRISGNNVMVTRYLKAQALARALGKISESGLPTPAQTIGF
jgi:hypothetical protein